MGDIIKKRNQTVPEILQNMIKPTETINRVTVRTTVQTDEAKHNIWQTSDKYGKTATFTNTKRTK